ncbi:glycosyltransferase family 2 protein [Crocosphaera sp. XPORK-15E]|uniref:glycosyltransferase family 2 protein n=1 Tax=Crocosphaera sp. XPORK-15E TaxID=3110247 RepID=UPI002B203707|nr:glycosyltransferase [Crocosphaera sp. XPORK-15E]MEA5534792.1 glycosyltransferase [Crocosphaera sp. XPORK-15E]
MEHLKTPKISIVLPSLNNREYLEERFQTILNQTFTDWELVIIDNYSDDGAWQLIEEFAQKDSRFKISQAPREGIYINWNNCIRLARGEYIYIATNDDTMKPDCLEKMIRGLEAHPECDICHVKCEIINTKGKVLKGYWEKLVSSQFYGDLINKSHIRLAPYDGILYCALGTVYFGPLQLLIRRSVFDKVGLFRSDWGPEGDFEWGMRAALVCNTLHIPETLVAWRIHSQQSTNIEAHKTADQKIRFIEMVQAALPILKKYNPEFYQRLRLEKLLFIYKRQQLRAGIKETTQFYEKVIYFWNLFQINPTFLVEFLYRRTFFPRNQSDDFTYIRQELKRLGLEQYISLC